MLINIANYYSAPRYSAIASGALALGAICSVTQNSNGDRVLTAVTTDAELAKPGSFGIAMKISSDPLQVDASTVPTELGNRIVAIKTGDQIVECRKGSIVAYDPSLLDASLDPARSGTLPVAGAKLGVKGGLPCAVGAASALIANYVISCYAVVNGKVLVELV